MGRPLKRGVEYFQLDTTMDRKMELIEASHGLVGYAVVVKLWQLIYGDEGYFYPFGDDEKLLFAKNNGITMESLESVLEACLARGVFSREKYDQHGILTSTGIQKRFFEITKKRVSISLIRAYLLVPAPESAVYSPETYVSAPESTQRKEKEVKGKEVYVADDGDARARDPLDTSLDSPEDEAVRRVLLEFLPCGFGEPTVPTKREIDDMIALPNYGLDPPARADLIIRAMREVAKAPQHKRGWSTAAGLVRHWLRNGERRPPVHDPAATHIRDPASGRVVGADGVARTSTGHKLANPEQWGVGDAGAGDCRADPAP